MNILIVGPNGYIGSRLAYDLVRLGYKVSGCDRQACIQNLGMDKFFQGEYQQLPDEFLEDIDVVLWFAGHTTVKMAQEDPWNAFNNNVSDLLAFVKRLNSKNIPLVYASSASLYSSSCNNFSLTANEERSNPYDATKLAFDILLNVMGSRAIGLRMATVGGWAPVVRWETLFNSLNRSAHTHKCLQVTNASNFRGVLFMDDLVEYILRLLQDVKAGKFPSKPIQVPLSSWSGSIGTMASEIARFWNADIDFGADQGTYSFVLTDRLLKESFLPNQFYKSIAQRCQEFADRLGWE